jgi:hypothetical protein
MNDLETLSVSKVLLVLFDLIVALQQARRRASRLKRSLLKLQSRTNTLDLAIDIWRPFGLDAILLGKRGQPIGARI